MADDDLKKDEVAAPTAAKKILPSPPLEKGGEIDYDRLVEDWWRHWFPNSPVSRQTEAWNQAVKAKDDLKRRLSHV